MIRKVTKNGYTIEYQDTAKYTQKEIDKMIDDSIKILQRREDQENIKDEAYLVHSNGDRVQKGDEVTDFRGDKAIVEDWQLPQYEGKSGRVYVKEIREDGKSFRAGYYPEVYGLSWVGLPWQKDKTTDSTEDTYIEDKSKGERIAEVFAKAFKGECGPMGGKNPKLDGNSLGLYSQAPTEWYTFNDNGSVDFDNAEEIAEWWNKYNDEGDEVELPAHFDSINDLLNSDLSWFGDLDDNKILKEVNAILNDKEEVKDGPVNAPEESIDITFNEKLKGGKNALTYGMIEQAYKDREKDGGKIFRAYIDVALESLKQDLKDAKYIVSGEMESVRKELLDNYVRIEHLIQKAGMEDKLAEFKPLVDELSDKLGLNYFKQPKFKKQQMKQASRELRNKHRWDSTIVKSVEPVFLCSKADLTASYNDAKQGKLPEVFEGNLAKVEKDMEADYDRINQGRDHYLEDPRIVKVLPKIVSLYELATTYADELGYDEIAKRFAYMLTTIKKGWGLE